jgi:hypothetical protein
MIGERATLPAAASPADEGGLPEDHVREEVLTYLKVNGWIVQRIEVRMGMTKGIPDLIAAKGGRAVWIELKSRGGRWITGTGRARTIKRGELKPEQLAFGCRWAVTGIPIIVARSWYDVHQVLVKLGIENNL